jgi:hypothetical protein
MWHHGCDMGDEMQSKIFYFVKMQPTDFALNFDDKKAICKGNKSIENRF